jgi:hypothetical protein
MGKSPFSGFLVYHVLSYKNKYILEVKSTVPNVKINFLTIAQGFRTSSKT